MKVKIKRLHKDAVMPVYAREGDAGLDLVATSININSEKDIITYGIGFALEIPYGYEGQVRPRSSIKNYDLRLINAPGTIDSGYRGEILVTFKIEKPISNIFNVFYANKIYEIGEKVAQLLIKESPYIDLVEVEELSVAERGEDKWGSTGK